MNEELNQLCLSLLDNPLQDAKEWDEYYQMVVEVFSSVGKLHGDLGGEAEFFIAGSSVQGGKFVQADDLGDVDIVVASSVRVHNAEDLEDVPGHPGSVKVCIDCPSCGNKHYLDNRYVKAKSPEMLSQNVQSLLVFFGQMIKEMEEFQLDLVFKHGTAAHTLEISSALPSPSQQLQNLGIAMTPLSKSFSENLTIAGLLGCGRRYGAREKELFSQLQENVASEVKKMEGKSLKFSEYIKSCKKTFDMGIQMVRQYLSETRPEEEGADTSPSRDVGQWYPCPHTFSDNSRIPTTSNKHAKKSKTTDRSPNEQAGLDEREEGNLATLGNVSADDACQDNVSSGLKEQDPQQMDSSEEVLYERSSGSVPIPKRKAEESFDLKLMRVMLGLKNDESASNEGPMGQLKQEDMQKAGYVRIPLELPNQTKAPALPPDGFPRKLQVDIVPAIKCTGWPKVAGSWTQRSRKWPPQHVVNNIVEKGFYLVSKQPEGEDPNTIYRLGFPMAETILSNAMTSAQRNCFRILKALHQKLFKPKTENFTSYHLKTLLFWASEDSDEVTSSKKSVGDWILLLLGNLQKALKDRGLPHYFIPELNLFQKLSDVEFSYLEGQVEAMLKDPVKTMRALRSEMQETEASVASRSLPGEQVQATANMNQDLERTFYDRWSEAYDSLTQEVIEAVLGTKDFDKTDENLNFVVTELSRMISKQLMSEKGLSTVFEKGKSMSYLKHLFSVSAMEASDIRSIVIKDFRTLVRLAKVCEEQGDDDAVLVQAMENIRHNDPDRFDMAELLPKVSTSDVANLFNCMTVPLPSQQFSGGEENSGETQSTAPPCARSVTDDIDLD